MKHCKFIAIDLAKTVFQVCIFDENNEVKSNTQFKRKRFIEHLAQYQPTTVVMEACYSANYFGRLFESYGHTVKLIPAQPVKPFVRGNKNDANDAIAIAEAARRPNMRFVPIKTLEQQDLQCLHRIRERMISQRTGFSNQIRGLLSEYGLIGSPGFKGLKALLNEALESDKITTIFREEVASFLEEWMDLSERIKRVDNKIKAYADQQENCQRLMSIPGIGVINATAIFAAVGDARHFETARDFAVWMGLTPKQHASGLKSSMGGITKRGNRYLRKQLIHGARSYMHRAKGKNEALDKWVNDIVARRGKHKACVALAHKLARIIWAVLTKQKGWESKNV